MANKNPQVDAYIQRAAPFAHPILNHLRDLIHDVCPTVQENIKWGMPSFEYKGLWCGFSAFKNHCSFGFWKAAIMKNAQEFLKEENRGSMGSIGKLTSVKDLPSDRQLRSWLKESMLLNEQGIKVPKDKTKHPKKKQKLLIGLLLQLKRIKKHLQHLIRPRQVSKKNMYNG